MTNLLIILHARLNDFQKIIYNCILGAFAKKLTNILYSYFLLLNLRVIFVQKIFLV